MDLTRQKGKFRARRCFCKNDIDTKPQKEGETGAKRKDRQDGDSREPDCDAKLQL